MDAKMLPQGNERLGRFYRPTRCVGPRIIVRFLSGS
jgi:hypothetical protein